jgi:hypothetical protein
MMWTPKQPGNIRLAAAAVLAVASMAGGPAALAQSGICPLTGNPPVPAAAPCNLQPILPAIGVPDTGTINPETWAYGPNTDLTDAQKAAAFWNPVKTRIELGLPFSGKRVSTPGPTSPGGYCSAAPYDMNSNHFTWVDMIHSGLVYSQAWPMWVNTACPGLNLETKGAKGILLPLDERESQHAADGGAIVYIFPVSTVADAEEAAFWTYYPPVGHHSAGGNQLGAAYPGGSLAPDGGMGQTTITGAGGVRNSFNRNVVLIAQIGTVEGAKEAAGIAAFDLIHAIYLDEADLLSRAGAKDYPGLASAVRNAAKANNKHLCTVDRSATPHTMNCARQ